MASYPLTLTIQNPATSNTSTGWTVTAGSITIRSTNPPPAAGTHYLAGGSAATLSAHQDVALPADAHADVDGGWVAWNASWLTAGLVGGGTARVILEARDASAALLSTLHDSGDATQEERWLLHVPTAGTLPVGTRTIRIRIEGVRAAGWGNVDTFYNKFTLGLSDSRVSDVSKIAVHWLAGASRSALLVPKASINVVTGTSGTREQVSKITPHAILGASRTRVQIAKVAVHVITTLTARSKRKPWLVILDADAVLATP